MTSAHPALAPFVVFAALAGLGDIAVAADWTRVPAAGVDAHFYDRTKVTIRGDEVTYWRKVVFSRPARVRSGSARSAVYQEWIHCRDHTLRTLAWQLYADDGAMIESAATPESEAAAIAPETIGDRFQAAMCDIVEARRRRDADIARDEALLATKRKELDALKAEIERLETSIGRLRASESASPAPATPEPPAQ